MFLRPPFPLKQNSRQSQANVDKAKSAYWKSYSQDLIPDASRGSSIEFMPHSKLYQTKFCLPIFFVLLLSLRVESAACRSPAFNFVAAYLSTSMLLSRSSRVPTLFFNFFYSPHFCKHTSASCVVTLDSGRLLFFGEGACVRAAGPFFSLRTLNV